MAIYSENQKNMFSGQNAENLTVKTVSPSVFSGLPNRLAQVLTLLDCIKEVLVSNSAGIPVLLSVL